jgi:hypothetical protein
MIIFETFNCFLDFFNLKFFQRNDRKVVPFFVDGATLRAGIWILSDTPLSTAPESIQYIGYPLANYKRILAL